MTGIEIAATAISSALGAIGAIQSGNAAAAASEYNAQNDRIQAGATAMAGSAEQARLQDQNGRRLASARNAAGANGFQANTGTPLDVIAGMAGDQALDAAIVRWNTQNKVDAGLSQAGLDEAQAKAQRSGGLLKAATTLLSGFGTAYGQGVKDNLWGGSSSALTVPSPAGGNVP